MEAVNVKKIYRKNYKILSIPSLHMTVSDNREDNGENITHEYAILGGMLYVDGEPVQHYYSDGMFYYENGDEQGSIFLREHGLMADIRLCKNGVVKEYKAGSELHYTIEYDSKSHHKLDAAFGMGIDSTKRSYYYCGLTFDGNVIIPVPEEENARKNQGVLSISAEEKTGRLVTDWNTKGYVNGKNKEGNAASSSFPITGIKMVFDESYNFCEVTLTEGTYDHRLYTEGVSVDMHLSAADKEGIKGSCCLNYTDKEAVSRKLELFGIDSVWDEKEQKRSYFCGMKYGGLEVVPVPTTAEEQKNQKFLKVSKVINNFSIFVLPQQFQAYREAIAQKDKSFCISGLSVTGTNASITEDRSQTCEYKAKGTLAVPNTLAEKRKQFRMNADCMQALKQNCMAANMNAPALTLELLNHIEPPVVAVEVEKDGKKTTIQMDGQQYCSYMTSSILTDLVNYYTGDISNQDNSMCFSDIFGKNKTACEMSVNAVSANIIKEIENAEDTKNNKKKGYLKDFLKTLGPIMLTNSLAEKTESAIVSGYGGAQDAQKALEKSRFYMTYVPKTKEENYNLLSTHTEYHEITAIIDKYVYISITKNLQDFMEDKTTDYAGQGTLTAQQYWAKMLYYHLVETIHMLHMTYEVNPARVTHLIRLLGILDSASYDIKDSLNGEVLKDDNGNVFHSSYALALYGQLSNYSVTQLIDTYKGEEDYENYCNLLIAVFGNFYDQVKNGKIKLPEDLDKDLEKFLREERSIFIEWSVFQAQTVLQLMTTTGSMMQAIQEFSLKVPNFLKFFSCINALMAAASFSNIFMNWKELTDVQKAQSILSVLSACFSVTRKFMIWSTINTLFDVNATKMERINAFYRYQVGGGTLDSLETVVFHDGDHFNFKDAIEESSQRYALRLTQGEGGETIEFVRTATSYVFMAVEIVFNILNIALLGIALVQQSLELDYMLKHKTSFGDFVIALSVINAILTATSLVLGITSFVLSFTSLASCALMTTWIPGLNAAVMILMLVVTILLLIFHKEPKAPITSLIEEKIKGEIEKLDEPKEGWAEENTPKNNVPLRGGWQLAQNGSYQKKRRSV